ncbi:MFS transporter [Natronoarchaeum philippinense]|uniref:MFS transporter n=1 Tax=Natronoarchaeum philippinense TaxID=558529 RepID=UPI000BE44032|nr:MFS transporter [Natronoarchaeum philippinense]
MNRNDRAIVGLVMLGHATVHTYELSIPVLVTVWLTEFGTTEAAIGAVVTVGYALFGLGAVPAGVLADRLGSHRLIVACLVGMGAAFALLGLTPSSPTLGLAVVGLALVLWGAAASIYHPSGLSLISTGVDERGTAFAYHGMAGNVGIAFGPLATLLLLEVLPWRTVTLLLAVPAAVGVALALRVDVDETAAAEMGDGTASRSDGDAESRSDGGTAKTDAVDSVPEFVRGTRALFAGPFVAIFAIVILSGLFYRGFLTFLPDILGGFAAFEPIEVAGTRFAPDRYVYVAILTVGIAGQYVGGKVTDRAPPAVGIAVAMTSMAVLAVAFLPAANAGLAAFLVVGALLGFFLFFVQPQYQAAVAEATPSGRRGLSYGFTYLGVFGVGALGGGIAGAILTWGSSWLLFAALAGVAVTAALVAVVALGTDFGA